MHTYTIHCKAGYATTDEAGNLLEDHVGRHYVRSNIDVAAGTWRILGIGKRAHSAHLVSLADAANGADIGQGWIHDLDHGSHRMWCNPSSRRATRVTRRNED